MGFAALEDLLKASMGLSAVSIGSAAIARAVQERLSVCHLADPDAYLERVRAFCDGKLVADHECIWARHQTMTDPAHWAAAQALRRQRLTVIARPAEPDVQIRCLADYDTALGLDDHHEGHRDDEAVS